MKKKLLSTLLALCLILALLPGTASAAQTTVYAGTTEELQAALQSNTKIVLEGKDYNVEYSLALMELENVTIQGTTGTRIMSSSEYSDVIWVYSCKNLVLDTLVLGHAPAASESGCTDGVIYAYDTEMTVRNCDIFGCGLLGIDAIDSTTTVENSTIRDCSQKILTAYGGTTSFKDCTFSGNGYSDPGEFAVELSSGDLSFSHCTFKGNKNPRFAQCETQTACSVENCTFTDNAWGDDWKAFAKSTDLAATPTASKVLVNGKETSFDAYNIGGANYFKLRDLAYVLNGTGKQFEVGWDGAANCITLTSGQPYTAVGNEMASQGSGNQTAVPTSSRILKDGAEVSLTAYNINGANYFKLRDIGQAFDFGVDWDNNSKTISIDTSKGYTAE